MLFAPPLPLSVLRATSERVSTKLSEHWTYVNEKPWIHNIEISILHFSLPSQSFIVSAQSAKVACKLQRRHASCISLEPWPSSSFASLDIHIYTLSSRLRRVLIIWLRRATIKSPLFTYSTITNHPSSLARLNSLTHTVCLLYRSISYSCSNTYSHSQLASMHVMEQLQDNMEWK